MHTLSFGPGGDVQLLSADDRQVEIDARGERIVLEVNFNEDHLRRNLLAAVAAARALDVLPTGHVELIRSVGRGRRLDLPGGTTVIDDCYNANPMSMAAALHELAALAKRRQAGRRVAVLGDMLELGPRERDFHEEIGEQCNDSVDLLVTVGPRALAIAERFEGEAYSVADASEAAALTPELIEPGDLVLVKASRAVGLELVCQAIEEES